MNLTELNTARYHGIGLTDLQILLLLAEHGPLDISALAERIGLTQAAISHAGKRLIAKHLIHVADRRHDILRDRREVWLSLGELGRVRIHQITGSFPEPHAGAERRVDCGSGHDYGVFPDCGQGHGHTVMRASVPVPL